MPLLPTYPTVVYIRKIDLKLNSKLTYKVSFELSDGYFFDKVALKNEKSYFLEYKFINQDVAT
jgi:hypothetical protein